MRNLLFALFFFAPVSFADDIADAPGTQSIRVHYVDDALRPIDPAHLPERIRFRLSPIPGGLHGVPLGVSLLDVEADVGDSIELDLSELAEQVAPIALQMQRIGAFNSAEIVPEDVKVLRLGTFASAADFPRIYASTGMAAGEDEPVTLVLVWFDRAASIVGKGTSGEMSFEYDISAPGAGFRWIQYEEFEPDRYRITDRSTEADPYLTIEIRQIDWITIEKREDVYWLMGRRLEGASHLISLLRDAGAHALMLDDKQEWSISDISTLRPMLDGSEFDLLYRDAEGAVRFVDQGQSQ